MPTITLMAAVLAYAATASGRVLLLPELAEMEGLMADAEDRSYRRVPNLDEDYNTWALLFKAYLVTKDLSQPIEKSLPPEGEAAALQQYNQKDRKALAEIILSVKIQHLPTLAEAGTARQAWGALEAAF
ncbi:hypothetical protein I4F81_002637 [Pyropia yezoensis]|uniref:Uncharacterized protein n=1 Tax=Pyropia yezoensis TaxID=2788 RepID=A0ACC3BQN1_PYRYE|nr:hypothetical protein I4F81_002637 [Neopyropia yezoensis]